MVIGSSSLNAVNRKGSTGEICTPCQASFFLPLNPIPLFDQKGPSLRPDHAISIYGVDWIGSKARLLARDRKIFRRFFWRKIPAPPFEASRATEYARCMLGRNGLLENLSAAGRFRFSARSAAQQKHQPAGLSIRAVGARFPHLLTAGCGKCSVL